MSRTSADRSQAGRRSVRAEEGRRRQRRTPRDRVGSRSARGSAPPDGLNHRWRCTPPEKGRMDHSKVCARGSSSKAATPLEGVRRRRPAQRMPRCRSWPRRFSAEGEVVLHRVPRITDVDVMAAILESLGARVREQPGGTLVIDHGLDQFQRRSVRARQSKLNASFDVTRAAARAVRTGARCRSPAAACSDRAQSTCICGASSCSVRRVDARAWLDRRCARPR